MAIVILLLKLRFRSAQYVTHVQFFVSKDLLRERSSECGNGGRTARWKVCNIDVNWAVGPRNDRACPPSDFGACSSLRANQIRLGVPSGFTMRASSPLAMSHTFYHCEEGLAVYHYLMSTSNCLCMASAPSELRMTSF